MSERKCACLQVLMWLLCLWLILSLTSYWQMWLASHDLCLTRVCFALQARLCRTTVCRQGQKMLCQALEVRPAKFQLAGRPGLSMSRRKSTVKACQAKASQSSCQRSGSGQHFLLGLYTFRSRAVAGGRDRPAICKFGLATCCPADPEPSCRLPVSGVGENAKSES